MPIRIYALAKDLKIDSKELVDICRKAGVTGKGSALASLTDEETNRVTAFIRGKDRPAAPPPPPPVLSPAVAAPPPVVTIVKESKSLQPITREDYIAPGAGVGKLRNLNVRSKSADSERVSRDEGLGAKSKSREPVIKLAAIPATPQTLEPPKSHEPAPQKPILTLPADAIRGAKSGTSAPLEQFTKQQEKKRSVVKPPPTTVEEPGTAAARLGRDRRRKAKDEPDVVPEETVARKGLAGMANARAARQQNRKRRTGRPQDSDDDSSAAPRRRKTRLTRTGTASTAAPRKGKVVIEVPCTVRSFSESTGVPKSALLRSLLAMGTMGTINSQLAQDVAEMMADEFDLDVEFRQQVSLEDQVIAQLDHEQDGPEFLVPRPPVVTFLGHVDHGKTSLLDRIIGIDVVSGEAGGITQHIRAYEVKKKDRKIAFVDTPGHEAFTEMRARGANVTDIAVLVVAADDGVMPQTEEAISHARAAEVPIIVALNKIDLPGVDINRVYQDLSSHGLLPVEWGGDVEVVKTSATTGAGIDDLLETILLTADLNEYQANPNCPAIGTCLEAQQEVGRGVVAKFIVQRGTLHLGDIVVCGPAHGRVKAMYDTLKPHKKVKEAGPSTPVNLTGLDVAPGAGDRFHVLDDIAKAREIADHRSVRSRQRNLSSLTTRVSFEEFQRRLADGNLAGTGEVAILNLILRADVRGSIEAIQKELSKLEHPEVQVKILQATVGGITVADVTLADASDAVVIGFNVIPDEAARSLADERGVEIRRYDIIYKVTEDIKAMLEGKLKPEERVADLGRALVQQVFTISRLGAIAGCRVLAGTIERGCRVRVNRDGRGIGDYPLESLRRGKDDTKEVREGFECGMKLAGFNDLKEGDILEAYKIEEIARSL